MLAGAVVLLLVALAQALFGGVPRPALIGANVVGYVLLVVGFGEAMRARRRR